MSFAWNIQIILNEYNFIFSTFNTIFYTPILIFIEIIRQTFLIGCDFSKIIFFKTHIINSVVFALKFLLLISVLIFVRGGVPRYRYDFLTKIGWIKFLSILLSLFLSTLLLNYLF